MTNDIKIHYNKVRGVLLIVLILNWAVALAKILYGRFIHAFSITADGFHSLADGTSNIIGIVGIYLACQPVDKEHPYGHKKYETFFSLIIAVLLFYISFELIRQGIKRISNPVMPNIDAISFAIMVVTLAVNMLVMRYEYRWGKDLKSDILISDSMHTRADILTSCSVILGLVVIKLGFEIIDPLVTMLVAIFIAYSGFKIAKQSSDVLCDTTPIVDEKKVSDIVLSIRGVRTCHKIRARGRPDDIYIDLHVQVSADMHVNTAHKLSYVIENEIKKNLPDVSDVLVHIEPPEQKKI